VIELAERLSAAGHADNADQVLVHYTWRQIRALHAALERRRREEQAQTIAGTARAITGALGDVDQLKRDIDGMVD